MAMSEQYLDDGHGNLWPTCGPLCQLEIVRPGKAQCAMEAFASCPPERKLYVRIRSGVWTALCPCCEWYIIPNPPVWKRAIEEAFDHIEQHRTP
jgi:hypothetical protein